jgi:hypothetical protein
LQFNLRMKTRISGSFLGLGAFTLLASPHFVGVASAQESLAGLGAASGIGATLGAGAAATSIRRPGAPRGANEANDLIDEAGNAGPAQGSGGAGTQAAAAPPPTAPIPQLYGIKPEKVVAQLRATGTKPVAKGGVPKRRESKAARQRRLARLAPTARKKAVQSVYKVPPTGWLSRYLPQDRYKFTKNWAFVSTEDSRYYFTPQAMAQRKFDPNRVIGFRTWQDAMQAGYKPDPLSKPEPAPRLLQLGNQTKGENYYKFVGYVYAGQVNPAAFDSTYKYSQLVAARLKTHRDAKKQVSGTLDAILGAALTGDTGSLPIAVGKTVETRASRAVVTTETTVVGGGADANGAPVFPGMPNAGTSAGASTQGDSRVDEFNRFRSNAGSMANVPANR